ncbi:MAG TPA: beta-ketoacyl-[acyl-carrier-protein] synthase family protein [Nitrospirota bacterium]|nr:beta-ketoacyl-[acyl-carrier-protein] synthase family protein [Nitrospirota bacterium]
MRRVAITGMGIISPPGNSCADFFNSLAAGKSAIRRMTADFSEQLSVRIAAEANFIAEEHFPKKIVRTLDRVSQFALAAASQAWTDAGLELSEEDKKRCGVYLGTGMGGAKTLEESYAQLFQQKVKRLNPRTVLMVMNNAAASAISIEYGLKGPCLTFSTACSSSAVSIGEAFRLIKHGYADVMLAGGSESLLTYGIMMSWESIGTLAVEAEEPSTSCRPFSKDRTGFVLGEGAAVLVLESMDLAMMRGARIYGEIAGYGSTADGEHITKPSVEGQSFAMQMALNEAGMVPDQIDYINAHGTATVTNDVTETQAIKSVFGPRAYQIPISSTKSMHGHLLGAAGAVELVAAVLALKNGTVPPTATLTMPDPECDLDYVPGKSRTGLALRAVMSNSFAFGGTNAVLIVRRHA